jgi:hypothetical protein
MQVMPLLNYTGRPAWLLAPLVTFLCQLMPLVTFLYQLTPLVTFL